VPSFVVVNDDYDYVDVNVVGVQIL